MQLLEDLLSDDEHQALSQVAAYPEHHFDYLVRASGLDPKIDFRYSNLRFVDFRGSDIRGFDFTGADLRYSTIDSTTLIDETTILLNANLEWLEEEEVNVVEYMLIAQSATSTSERRRALKNLVNNSNSANHVNKFLVKSIKTAGNLDAALDFCDYVIGEIPDYLLQEISESLLRLMEKKANAARSRTGRKATINMATDALVERISKSNSHPMRVLLNTLANYEESKIKGNSPSFMDHVEVSFEDIAASIRKMTIAERRTR